MQSLLDTLQFVDKLCGVFLKTIRLFTIYPLYYRIATLALCRNLAVCCFWLYLALLLDLFCTHYRLIVYATLPAQDSPFSTLPFSLSPSPAPFPFLSLMLTRPAAQLTVECVWRCSQELETQTQISNTHREYPLPSCLVMLVLCSFFLYSLSLSLTVPFLMRLCNFDKQFWAHFCSPARAPTIVRVSPAAASASGPPPYLLLR